MRNKFLSWLLVLAIVLPMLPVTVRAAEEETQTGSMPAHTDCGREAVASISSIDALTTAVAGGGDIVLTPSSGDEDTWTVSKTLNIAANQTVHIAVEAGKKVTLTRGSGFTGQLFSVEYGGRLILGDGSVAYAGDTLAAAGETGAYTVESSGGELVIDGGAVWAESTSNVTAYFVDENGERKAYRNTGRAVGAAMIENRGALDIWGGVTLQNNVRTSGAGSAVCMPNTNKDTSPELNLYGGVIQWCATTGMTENGSGAAIYCGNSSTGWTSKPTDRYGYVNLWAGEVKHNANYAASGAHNGDGATIALDAATLKLYGGKVAFNCGDTGCTSDGYAADGGGVGIRMGDASLYGGEISNNWTGGFGGGMCLWNADATLVGTAITENQAAFGGGIAIAGHGSSENSKLTMTGGTIAYNEAVANSIDGSGVGGGICVGTATRRHGSVLEFSGGTVQQNKAETGGGVGVYAGKVTNVKLSGNVVVSANSAYQNGSGMYLVNGTDGDSHTLLDMSGGARIDTNNPVYFANLIENQVPVNVSGSLTTAGTAAIFEFSQSFWNGTDGSFDKAAENRKIVSFKEGLDIQENKIAMDSTAWYLSANSGISALELKTYEHAPLYTIRNGTPVTVSDLKYYRVYQSLDEATAEAADGDILYIFYNATIDAPAKVTGKKLTLLAESSSSAGLAAASSGSGKTKTCWLEEGDGADWVMEGSFLKYVGSGGNQLGGKYNLDGDDNTYRYNIRNDYTITLSKALYLGESGKGGDAGEAAIIVGEGAGLEVGQTATAGMGAGKLTFDGNLSYPEEGPMFQTTGDLTFHDGITVMNHSNYSEAHPGTVEVQSGGVLSMESGVTLKNGVSPVAGAVYVHDGGTFDMKGGSIFDNCGAVPRYGFVQENSDEKLAEYDRSYWGQAKYYYGAGAVYNLGSFTMSGGTISGNRGEYGAIATMGSSTLVLSGGSVTENHALIGTGDGEYDLKITGYTDAGKPARGTDKTENAGSGGGVYIGGSRSVTVGGSVSISGNTAAENGGGIAMGEAADLTKTVNRYDKVTNGFETTGNGKIAAQVPSYQSNSTRASISVVHINDRAAVTDNDAQRLGGGIYTESSVQMNVTTASAISGNHAKAGGGLAAEASGKMAVESTVTGNTAVNGGGAYVGKGTTVVLQGNLTDNTADNGGGAYVDNADDPGATSPGATGSATGNGKLVLSGAFVNNNKINGSGLGVGVYNRGSLELQASGIGSNAVQPYTSANDRIYLESGHFITLKDSYLPDRQSETDKLTVLTRDKSNGTKIMEADNAKQAEQMLTMLAHGEGASMTRNTTDQRIIEINQNTVHYYRETVADTGDNVLEISYVPGSEQTLRNYGFETPEGKSFSGWLRVSSDGTHYISKADGTELALTDANKERAKYQAGDQITLNNDYYFVADYTNTQYTAKVLVDMVEISTGATSPADSADMVSLGGVTTSAEGDYSYGMGAQISVNPGAPSEERVLQAVEIYEETEAGDVSFEERGVTGTWKKVAWAELEEEHLILAPKTDTDDEISVDVKNTGNIEKVSAEQGTKAALINGLLNYTAYAGNIVVRVTYKEPRVSLTLQNGFVGYYDSPHRAQTAMVQRMEAEPGNMKVIQGAQIKLLRADEDTPGVVSYYGKRYGEQLRKRAALTAFSKEFLEQTSSNMASFTCELNGLELNYAGSGRRVLNGYDLTMQHGSVRFVSLSGADDENRPLSGYRVENGTLTLNAVQISVNEPETYYAVKVMDNGNLEIGRGCTLGRVFIHSDARDAVDGRLGTDATVLITEDFDVNRSDDDPVATLCMNRWNFGNGERQVFRLSDQPDETGEAMKASVGPNIRRLFRLEDVSASTGTDGTGLVNDQEPHDKKWFIGTDGMLYRKAAQLVPKLTGLDVAATGEGVDRYQANWISGYPFYANYKSQYGESGDVTIQAQLLDAYDQPIPKAEGTVSFMVNRVQPVTDGSPLLSRQTSGMVSPDPETGTAEIEFTHIKTLQANVEQGWYSVTASWAGTAQYAPQYAKYWNYNYIDPNTEDENEQAERTTYAGYVGSSLTSGLELTVEKRDLDDSSITVGAMTPDKAEYIGEKGLEQGYASAPTIGRAQHQMGTTSMNMILGSDANIFYVALTSNPDLAVKTDGQQVESCTHDGVTYYYLAGANGGKIYYRVGGEGDGTSVTNAKKINSAPAGTYRIGLEAETLDTDGNYTGYGEKAQHFVIEPYGSMLNVTGPNHVLVSEGEDYAERIKSVLEAEGGLQITDRYGNVLDAQTNCSYRFITVSGSAKLDKDGWPASEGLYSLVASADANAIDNKLFTDTAKVQDTNYSGAAKGYMAVLITNTPLTMQLLPDRVTVPYTGKLYTDEKLKKQFDRGPAEDTTEGDLGEEPPDGYKVVLIDAETKQVVEELSAGSYRLEIGSPQHMPREVGIYTMVVTDKTGKYTGIGTLEITTGEVKTISMSEDSGIYTGGNHNPTLTVQAWRNGETVELIRNRGFFMHVTEDSSKVEVAAPINAGSYTYQARGVGNYVGDASKKYTVIPKKLDNSDCGQDGQLPEVTVDYPEVLYVRNRPISIDYSVFYNGMVLRNSEDFTLKGITKDGEAFAPDAAKPNSISEAGIYVITIEGKGNYQGTRSFAVEVRNPLDDTHKLHVSNTEEFVYSGVPFQGYNWAAGAMIEWDATSGQDDTSRANVKSATLDISRFDFTLKDVDGNLVPEDQVLDAGVYIVEATAKEDYWNELGSPEPLVGNCIMRIKRRQVTVTVDSQEKIYGEADSIQNHYSTDIHVSNGTGFYEHDRDRISGNFSRNSGENVQLGGYRYTLGSFTAGDNYVLLMSMNTVYTINPKDITNASDVTLQTNGNTYSYSGYAPDVVTGARYKGYSLGENAQYVLTYEQKIPGEDGAADVWVPLSLAPADVGEYRVTVDCDLCTVTPDNYIGSQTVEYRISNTSLALNVRVDGSDTVVYDGEAHTPNILVTTAQGNLVNSSNYTITYSYSDAVTGKTTTGTFILGETSFTNAGSCTLYVSGTGNYAGATGQTTFTIQPKDISDEADTEVEIALTKDEGYTYTGQPVRAEVEASYTPDGGQEQAMQVDTDYTLAYANHTQAGEAAVTVTGRGNFTGSRTLNYTIQKKQANVTVDSATLTKVYGAADPVYTYQAKDNDGNPVRIYGTITREGAGTAQGEDVGSYELDTSDLTAGGNYQLAWEATPKLTITQKAIAEQDGTTPAENISITVPASVAAENGVTLEKLAAQIQVMYWAPAMSAQTLIQGSDYTLEVQTAGGTPVTETGSLASGVYRVILTGQDNYSGSYTTEVTVIAAAKMLTTAPNETVIYTPKGHKKSFTPKDKDDNQINGCQIELSVSDVAGNTRKETLIQAEDGSISLNLTDVGTYTVVVTKTEASESYYGTVTYTVQPKNVGDGDITVSGVEDSYDYTGEEVRPENITLSHDETEVQAVAGTKVNFVCTYANNVNPSTADKKATVTIHGQGNYIGSRVVSYQIGETRYSVVYYNPVDEATGTVPTDDGKYPVGGHVIMPASGMSASGLAFMGWTTTEYKALAQSDKVPTYYAQGATYTVPEGSTNPIAMYALWGVDANANGTADCVENTYQLIYHKGTASGTQPETKSYIAGTTAMVDNGSLALEKFVLLGWTKQKPDSGDEHKFMNAAAYNSFTGGIYKAGNPLVMAAEETYLYPVWGVDDDENGRPDWEKPTQRYVRYSANGGTNEPPGVFVPDSETETEIAPQGNTPSRADYQFVGWTKEAREPLTRNAEVKKRSDGKVNEATVDGKAVTVYQSQDTYTFTENDGMFITFYALWAEDRNKNQKPDYEEQTHKVSFVNASATVTASNLPNPLTDKLEGENVTLPTQIPRGSYGAQQKAATFLGWTNDRAAAEKLYTRTEHPTVTVYARGGSYTLPQTMAEDENVTLYALWGDADYNKAEYTVMAAVVHGKGDVKVDPERVLDGNTCTVTITPEAGYQLSQVVVNGVAQANPSTSMQLTITQDTNVVVSFVQSASSAKLTPEKRTYNGASQPPTLTVKDGDNVLTVGTDYIVKVNGAEVDWNAAFVKAGTYTITVEGRGTYVGNTHTLRYVIEPANFSVRSDKTSFTYSGSAISPTVLVTGVRGEALTADDYTVTYQTASGTPVTAAKNVGNYVAVYTGKGNYQGSVRVSFQITPSNRNLTVTAPKNRTYNGEPYYPEPAVRAGTIGLQKDRDYTLSYNESAPTDVGYYTVKATGMGNYKGTGSAQYRIVAKKLDDSDNAGSIEVIVADAVYDGTAQKPMVVVTYTTGERVLYLTEGQDYSCTYKNNVDVFTGESGAQAPTVSITGKGNYTGTIAKNFKIIGKTFTDVQAPPAKTYNGRGQEPAASEIVVKDGGTTLRRGTHYDIAEYVPLADGAALDDNGKPRNAGTYTIRIKGKDGGNYAGYSGTATFVIRPALLTKLEISESYAPVYDGTAQTPDGSVLTVSGPVSETLQADRDYTLVYQNNENAGNAIVTAVGRGNYTGTVSGAFTIQKAKLLIEPINVTKTYGTEDSLSFQIAESSRSILAKDLVGNLTRTQGEKVGEYAIMLNTLSDPTGNYSLELTDAQTFTIEPKSITEADVQSETKDTEVVVGYTGSPYQASPTIVYDSGLGNLLLARAFSEGDAKDYRITYDGSTTAPTEAGTYTVQVEGIGNYKDTYTYTLRIVEDMAGAVLTDGDQKIYNGSDWVQYIQENLQVTIPGTPDATDQYDLQYFAAADTDKAEPLTEIRNAGVYTIEVKPKDTSVQAVDVTFTVLQKDIADATVTVSPIADQTYAGSAVTPEVALQDTDAAADLTAAADYTVTYQGNVNVGTAQAVIRGMGNYTGTRAESFNIQASAMQATIEGLTDVVYNGLPQWQKPAVKSGTATLTENVDYTLSYSDDTVNVGTVTVTVNGIGNYTGTLGNSTYQITPKTIQAAWIQGVPEAVTYTGVAQTPIATVRDPDLYTLTEDMDYTISYAGNTNVGTASITVIGQGNFKGTAKKNFEIQANSGEFVVQPSRSVPYNGKDQKPKLTVQINGRTVDASEYKATYRYNGGKAAAFNTAKFVNVGVYAITVTGVGGYQNANGTAMFAITPGSFTASSVSSQDYTGKPVTPSPVVKDGSKTLTAGVDYTLNYKNNIQIGTAAISVVGRGNYAGCVRTVNFKIVGERTAFRVTYHGNGNTGGTVPKDSATYVQGDRVTVRSTAESFSRRDAVLLGWAAVQKDLLTSQAQEDAVSWYQPGSSFTIAGNTTLYALWAADQNHNGKPDYSERVTITASAGEGGTITPSGQTTLDWGTAQAEFTIKADTGYAFSGVTVDGELIHVSTADQPTALRRNADSTYTYTFTDIRKDHVIVGTFRAGGTPDSPTDPADSGVSELLDTSQHNAYMQGRGENQFWPDANITRAEVAMIFYRLLRDQNVPITTTFSDVNADAWYADAVNTLASLGILNGYPDGSFRPDQSITRGEFATITARLAYSADTGVVVNFSDVAENTWYYDNIQLNAYYGWVQGYPDGSFRPERNIARAEATKIVNYMTGRIADRTAIDSGRGTRFEDVADMHWAFYHITEAATGHDFIREDTTESWK